LEWCRSNRILVAVFPPYSTHRLQPLDVSLFRPLASYYSQSLDAQSRLSQGLASITKRDFFKSFYSAFDKAFTEANISSRWLKTGKEPFDPDQVLKIFKREGDSHPEHYRLLDKKSLENATTSAAPWSFGPRATGPTSFTKFRRSSGEIAAISTRQQRRRKILGPGPDCTIKLGNVYRT